MSQLKVVLLLLFLTISVSATITFLPNVDFDVDLGYFFFHKNKKVREQFMFESECNSRITLFSIDDRFSFIFNPMVRSGLGRSPYGMVLHPCDISYGLLTSGEYRTPSLTFFMGLDHSCFHEVDQKIRPTTYWNKLFTGLESHNRYEYRFLKAFGDSGVTEFYDRISWRFTWSWYIREFLGMIEPIKVMTPHIVNYHDITFDAKYAFFHRNNWVVSLTNITLLGISNDKSFYYRETMGITADFRCKSLIPSLFITYSLDKKWFDSRDRLFEIGIKIVK